MAEDPMWPSIPTELKYVELRLPGTFRELTENRKFTNEEIGRIVRCIALDTDFFITQKIEPEVFYYRQRMIEKNRTRMRVKACRKRKSEKQAGQLSADMERRLTPETDVTVTDVRMSGTGDTLFSNQKTSPIIAEKISPIVPLEKSHSSPLESATERRKPRTRKERLSLRFQDDLFAIAGCSDPSGRPLESRKMPQGCPVRDSESSDGSTAVQDIEHAPRPVFCGLALRPEEEWIIDRFDEFWRQYPRHIGKCSAQKVFIKLIRKQKNVEKFMEKLLDSLKWWKQQNSWTDSLIKNDGQFIPYPATWLNRGSWEDATENKTTGAKGSAEFLNTSSESDEELLRRMQGG